MCIHLHIIVDMFIVCLFYHCLVIMNMFWSKVNLLRMQLESNLRFEETTILAAQWVTTNVVNDLTFVKKFIVDH